MGCFDSVCSFSRVPVHYDDDVVAQYVFSGTESTMPESRWGQIGFPIFGKYNDYGDVEDVDTSHINYEILKSTCEGMKDEIRLMDRCQYDSDKPELLEIFMHNTVHGEQMLDSFINGRGTYEKSDRKNDRFNIKKHSGNSAYLCFIHREVYNYVVSVGAKCHEDVITADAINEYLDFRRNTAGSIVRIMDDILYDDNADISADSFKNAKTYDHKTNIGRVHNYLIRRVNDCYPSLCSNTYTAIGDMMKKLLPELTYDHPFIKALVENKQFRLGRMLLNLELVPHFSYAINQYREDSDLHRIRNFHRMVAKFSTTLIRRNDD